MSAVRVHSAISLTEGLLIPGTAATCRVLRPDSASSWSACLILLMRIRSFDVGIGSPVKKPASLCRVGSLDTPRWCPPSVRNGIRHGAEYIPKKGIVEVGGKYLKINFLPLRKFRNLADLTRRPAAG